MHLITKTNVLLITPILAILVHYFVVFSLDSTEIKLNTFNIISVLVISVLILVLSFIEELIFRGFLLDAFGNTYKSIFLNSTIFALVHIFNAGFFPVAIVVTFLISVILCLVKIYSGIKQCIYLHFFWNWIVAVLLSDTLSGISVSEVLGEDSAFAANSTIFRVSYIDSIWFGSSYGLENGLIVLIALVFGLFIQIGLKHKK